MQGIPLGSGFSAFQLVLPLNKQGFAFWQRSSRNWGVCSKLHFHLYCSAASSLRRSWRSEAQRSRQRTAKSALKTDSERCPDVTATSLRAGKGAWLCLGSVWGACPRLPWCPQLPPPVGLIPALFTLAADHLLNLASIQDLPPAACFNWWGCGVVVLNSRQMVLKQGPHTETRSSGAGRVPHGYRQVGESGMLPEARGGERQRGSSKEASPLQLAHLSRHRVFPRRAAESLPGPAPSPRCHRKSPFCWKEWVGRAPQRDGWSSPSSLQAARGAGMEPGKGFRMRPSNASLLLNIVAGRN